MSGKNWILLVAGSKDWPNYKHQANVCLHYQILKHHPEPIPDEQIVVMMYDDIAHNGKNPSDGNIVSVVDESNVYSGVPKDYTKEYVTPENFLAALRGDKSTNKKVIESGPNDNIFVYMSGVGQEGAFPFPEKALSPKDLIETLKRMHYERKFSKMVIYMDGNYSATMFEEQLPIDINVFAVTSCPKYAEITPTNYDELRGIFRSDKFSSTWLTYLNTADFTEKTFHDLVKGLAKKAKCFKESLEEPCACRFGDKKIAECHLSDFLKN